MQPVQSGASKDPALCAWSRASALVMASVTRGQLSWNRAQEGSPKQVPTLWRVIVHLPRYAAAAVCAAEARPRPPSIQRRKHCAR